ncbi:T9SS type A sorting domain-containing protein [Aquimarina agarivorans]|uniref:T9SS type A sorting domain-containing protein n=1 Tax=Aquimarina agarivorans TaxID=980584 RepID=UPI000248FCDF|nr:T9SS type A sorting domain-containing protein [Aquimarina agarivorans]
MPQVTTTFSVNSTRKLFAHPLFLISFLLFFNTAVAKTWYINKTQGRNVLQSLINNASEGDLIYFIDGGEGNDYDMSGPPILVNKGITFQGAYSGMYTPSATGHSGVVTNLTNVVSFQIRSNNVKFNNIKITAVNNEVVLIDARSERYNANFTNPGYTANDQYEGIEFTNVALIGGFYSCFSGNGMQADFTNVSFSDFGRIGYINDRRTRVNGMKKVTFTKCKFEPLPPTGDFGFDSRGISLDAGNTSYPVVWSGNGSYIKACEFVNTGVAFSRIKNIVVENNKFSDDAALVDMIHIEEFSNDFTIKGNTFECNAKPSGDRQYERSRIITLDSELQAVTNITINNNIVTGEYNFFVNGYAPTNITIKNNNLSKGFPFGKSYIDFRYYENRFKTGEGIDDNQEFTSRAITITGNTGFKNWNKECRINVPKSGGAITIHNAQFGSGKVLLNAIDNPTALRSSGVYEIVNAGNINKKLASNGAGSYGLVTKQGVSNNSVKWEFEWVPPYYYHIKNVDTGMYLETHKGYTETEIKENKPETVYPFLNYAGSDKPKWILRKTSYTGLFKILPAGNEKQSVLSLENNTYPKLIKHKKFNSDATRSIKEPNDYGKWWINPSAVSSGAKQLTLADNQGILGMEMYPNPANDIVTIYYEDDNQPVMSVEIFNAIGGLVMTDQINSHSNTALDISNLTSGVYFVKASNGKVKKLLVQ